MSPIYLSTRDCADLLDVSQQFIRDEIRSGRLEAEQRTRPVLPGRQRAKPFIRVPVHEFRRYCERYFPSVVPHLPAA